MFIHISKYSFRFFVQKIMYTFFDILDSTIDLNRQYLCNKTRSILLIEHFSTMSSNFEIIIFDFFYDLSNFFLLSIWVARILLRIRHNLDRFYFSILEGISTSFNIDFNSKIMIFISSVIISYILALDDWKDMSFIHVLISWRSRLTSSILGW